MCLFPKDDRSLENAVSFLIESGVEKDRAEALLATLYLALRKGVDSDSLETAKACLVQNGVKKENTDKVLAALYPIFNLEPVF